MSVARKGADVFLFQLMVLLCAIWGHQQVAIKLAAADIAPLLQVALRSGIAALLVGALMLWQRDWQGWLGCTWRGATGQLGPIRWTPISVGSLLLQGVVVSFLSYLTWFWLLRRYLASNMAVFSFMTPLFGVSFGVLILDEPLSLNFVAGAALVLLGIVLVSNHAWVSKRLSLWRYAER